MLKRHPVKTVVLSRRAQKQARNATTTTISSPPTSSKSFSTSARPAREDSAGYNYEIMARALSHPETPKPYVRKVEPCQHQPEDPMDGNQAAAYIAYAMSETSFIYPISPATSMGEHMDNWASQGRKNSMGQVVRVTVMQSEAGAAGACHGSVAAGVLTSTFTASQGLLLMIPNLYLMAGELMPIVLHVSARTVAKHALSIFNDHSDVMACRQTGFALLCSNSVQEVMDLGLVAHLASIRSRVPFLHFFDGYRTSAEIAKIKVIPYADIARLIPEEELRHNLRDLALNPQHPIIRGTGQRPDIFFQSNVANQRFYDACPDIVQACMDEVAQLTGRQYKLYEYYGSETAERVVIMMGSAAETAEDVIDHMNSLGENVGILKVRLFRPFKSDYFVKALPKTVKKVVVLDRTREEGAQGNPLYLDVVSCLTEAFPTEPKMIIGGTYGLASKEFTPGQLKAVFDNLNVPQPKRRFVVGILDDVTNTSLNVDESYDAIKPGITQCMFWGLGGDGTIGANKSAIKNLAKDGGLNAQGYFSYDSHKEMGATVSHLRFGKTKIKAHYMINNGADYIASHHPSYTRKFDLCAAIRQNGIFVLNCPWTTLEEIEEHLPPRLKRQLATRNVRFYVINATRLAMDLGLGMRINTLMQSCFYRLSGVLPVESALNLLKNNILDLYSKKGPEVVKANQRAVDAAGEALIEIKFPASWAEEPNIGVSARELKDKVNVPKPVADLVSSFVKNIMDPVLSLDGDQLPVSKFTPGGFMPTATCMHEERGLAAQVPVWEPDKCTQCNYCAIVCPHAVIRPFLMDKSDLTKAPEGFESRRATGGAEFAGLNFSITISTNDCTGCAICVASCPDDALHMEPYEQVRAKYGAHWDYVINLPTRNPADKMTVKGSQFQQPLLEFSGACPGCGETPYVKLVTQLFGDRMVIANASGCSSVWGGTATTNPYTVNEKGQGPAWGRSLFEDNAEYGFGMALGTLQRRLKLKADVEAALATVADIPKTLKASFEGWVKNFDNYDASDKFVNWIEQQIPEVAKSHPILQRINNNMDVLRPQSHWIVGGDGWAYDIGFGGLDHVLSRGENVNIMVLDTEMYSNTGGQVSKSTQMSTVLKFAQSGKKELKKDLGIMAMTYGNVYVASVALGANYNQCVQAFKEAESFPGTSLILCYSPCIDWGIDMQYQMESQRIAVDSGYWKLYRYDPRLTAQGKVPMQLDSPKIKTEVKKFLETQNRFKQLLRKDKKKAESYFSTLSTALANKHENVKRQSMDNLELLDHLKSLVGETSTGDKALVLYASETGTAADVAKMFANELKRRHIRSKCVAMDDYDFDNLPSEKRVFIIGATCGQGEFPANSRTFWKMISDPKLPSSWLKDTQYAVFSLGDHAYVYYNKVGKDLDARFAELGAQRIVPIGLANEKDDEKWETAWTEWIPELWNELGTEAPPEEIPVTSFKVAPAPGSAPETDVIIPQGAKLVPLQVSQLLCSPDYDRDIRHFELDLSKSTIAYNLGDSLGVYPWNEIKAVNEFLNWMGVKGSDVVSIQDDSNSGKFPTTVTLEQVFAQVLDIFGRPSRKFYETLALLAKDPKEANEIRTLMSKEGKAAFKQFLKETPNYVDLLQRWPSAKLTVDQLLEFVPRIKPRLYSIASAPSMDGDRLHLCIVADDWRTPSGRYKHGLTTRYLRDLTPTNDSPVPVAVRVNNASFALPANHKQPLLLVGLGTGIAPCRALIRDRLNAKRRGEEVGPIALFFGVRTRAQEYSYGEEWDELHKEGLITILANAFSRDQEKKIYVQHRITEHSETVYNWIVKNNGYYLLCGPGGPPCVASKEAIIQSLVDHGGKEGFDKEKAIQYVTDMQISGRYNEEVW